MLSVRVKNGGLNTAVALGISVRPERFKLIASTIKEARKAYRRGTSIFIDDQLTSNLWLLVKRLMAEDNANVITKESVEDAIRDTLQKDTKAAVSTAKQRKRDELIGMLAPAKQEKPTFHQFYDKYVQDFKDGTRMKFRGNKKVSNSTISCYNNLLFNIKKFEEHEHIILDWSDLTLTFFIKFKSFITNRGLKANTVSTYIFAFRGLMKSARRLHYTMYDDFDDPQLLVKTEEPDNVYLTSERIKQLYAADLGNEEWIEEKIKDLKDDDLHDFIKTERHRQWLCDARDVYVVGCLTGQRYSDYIRINEQMYEYINGRKFIHLRQIKTGAEVYIPVDPKVEAILIRHKGSLPQLSKQKLTKMIRKAAVILGWNEPVPLTMTKGGMSYTENVPFYDMLKTHTCRRSFATNAYRANVPLAAIMAVTGHSSEDMLRKYLKLSNKERALYAAEELLKLQSIS